MVSFFCPCPRGMEDLLAEELREITTLTPTLQVLTAVAGGVHCSGNITDAWWINLHSRLASRVLLRIAQRTYHDEQAIYDLAVTQTWENWFTPRHTLRVDVTATRSPIRSLAFVTLRIKDAICDRFRQRCCERPFVNTRTPDIRIVGFLDAQYVTLYLDTSGEALFKRGWRQEAGDAPLRENLAAGLLRASGWQPGMGLLDPMCGSGTFLVEAAQTLAGIPPGKYRSFAFEKFNTFDEKAKDQWQRIKATPRISIASSLMQAVNGEMPTIFGSDISGHMIAMAWRNLRHAGIGFDIPLKQIAAQAIQAPECSPGILLMNPPYGERISVRGEAIPSTESVLSHFFDVFGMTLKNRFSNWRVCIFSADKTLPQRLRLKPLHKIPFYNGALACRLFQFDIVAAHRTHSL